MFKIIYAKSVLKDLRKISKKNLPKIKMEIEELKNFPNPSLTKPIFIPNKSLILLKK